MKGGRGCVLASHIIVIREDALQVKSAQRPSNWIQGDTSRGERQESRAGKARGKSKHQCITHHPDYQFLNPE